MSTRPPVLVPFPQDVIAALDEVVPPGDRNAFLVELTKHEIKRRRLLKILENPETIWKPEDHPDIDDSGAWLRELRRQSEARFRRVEESADRRG